MRVFDSDIGDLVIKVCSSIIKVPVIVITFSRSVPVVPFTLDEPLTNQPIYITYHYYGAGHYDATNNKISGKNTEVKLNSIGRANNSKDLHRPTDKTCKVHVSLQLKHTSKLALKGSMSQLSQYPVILCR